MPLRQADDTVQRRLFLKQLGLGISAGLATSGLAGHAHAEAATATINSAATSTKTTVGSDLSSANWQTIQQQFPLQKGPVHMAGFLLTSHPKPVGEAIERHRRALDSNPATTLMGQEHEFEQITLTAAARYLGDKPENIALVESTTAGLATLYNGIKIRADQEILTTEHDHYVTFSSLDMTQRRSGAAIKRIALYDKPQDADVEQIVSRLDQAINSKTRLIAITWVHSGTGVKLPIREISERVANANRGRAEADRALLCVDGVHGFGVDAIDINTMGCDFFVAGTHKWMFGPRGTGILWAKQDAQPHCEPTIPTFELDALLMWMGYKPQQQLPWSATMSPGGTHAFEHRWALADAFQFHLEIGKQRIANRIQQLNGQLKEGLQAMSAVRLHTPQAAELSAGITAFELDKLNVIEAVSALGQQGVIATPSPYRQSYVRLAPGIINSETDVERCLAAVKATT